MSAQTIIEPRRSTMHAKPLVTLVTLALIGGLTFVAVTIGDQADADKAAALARADADLDNDLDFDDVDAFVACHHEAAKPRDEAACPPALAAKFDLDADGDVDNDDFFIFINDYDAVNPPHPAAATPGD
jgi:hypothetical protein